MTNIDYPLRVDSRGRTALTQRQDHVRDLIEQVLFTSPGERVNRPTFGCGLLQLVFQPNSEPLELAVKATVQASVQQWLGELIAVQGVSVVADDAILTVTVSYSINGQDETQTDEFRIAP